jgi:hypothetical protein
MLLELHVAHDVGAQWAWKVRQRRAAKARMQLLCNGRTSYLGAAFEDERFESRLGQIECGDKTVVAAADNNNVTGFRCRSDCGH